MADDLGNNWGVIFTLPDDFRRSTRQLPLNGSRPNSGSFTTLTRYIKAESNKFLLEHVSINGSQANSWCVFDATCQNVSLCLFAAGSYVAGDASGMQSFSTSEFSVGYNLAMIGAPTAHFHADCRSNTVPLPYHIPNTLSSEELAVYEDTCLQSLHIKLCCAKMQCKPYRALFLELILAGNGASLSNNALISLGKLAKHHRIGIIVDEIMTGGRSGCDSVFHLFSKPLIFQAQVTHITLGNWCQIGIVVCSQARLV
jgi:hypothetical protein